MKKFGKKLSAIALIMALGVTALTGCGSSDNTQESQTQESQTEESAQSTESAEATDTTAESSDTADTVSGSITMAGSTSMEKFANALSEAFMTKHSGVTVNAEFIGSSAGIEALLGGSAQIGNASRSLEDSEIQSGAVENVVAIDGIVVAVDTSNTITNITVEDLKKVFTGEITNWSDLGGENMPIVVVGREAGSGTRGAFEELLEIEDKCAYANELDSTGAVMAKVASTKGAIGYVSLDVVDDTIIPLSLEGVEPTVENIKSGDYVLSRPFVMATLGEISAQTPEVQELFNYIKSDEGKALIESVGLITAD